MSKDKKILCSVPYCKIDSRNKRQFKPRHKYGIITHLKFPKDEELSREWMRHIKCKIDDISNSYVCSEHFLEHDFDRDIKYEFKFKTKPSLVLKSDSIPSVFTWNTQDLASEPHLTEGEVKKKRAILRSKGLPTNPLTLFKDVDLSSVKSNAHVVQIPPPYDSDDDYEYEVDLTNNSFCFICQNITSSNSPIPLASQVLKRKKYSKIISSLLCFTHVEDALFFKDVKYCANCEGFLENIQTLKGKIVKIEEELENAKKFLLDKIEKNYGDYLDLLNENKENSNIENENIPMEIYVDGNITHDKEKEEGKFSCSVPTCFKTFEEESFLNTHFTTAHLLNSFEKELKRKPFKCSICAIDQCNDAQHLSHTHLICPYCNQYFRKVRRRLLWEHIYLKHHRFAPFMHCDICNKIHYFKDDLSVHLSEHSGRRHPFDCIVDYCNKSFNDAPSLKDHVTNTHDSPQLQQRLKCQSCNKDHLTKILYAAHLYSVHESKENKNKNSIICPECNLNYYSESSYISHFTSVHSHLSHPFQCPVLDCEEKFTNSKQLKTHTSNFHSLIGILLPTDSQNLKSGNVTPLDSPVPITNKIVKKNEAKRSEKWRCEKCNGKFKSEFLKTIHVKKVHEGVVDPYECSTCLRSFSHHISLLKHTETAHTGLSLLCPVCGLRFSSYDKLSFEKHMYISHPTLTPPYTCSFCSRIHYLEESSEEHRKLHEVKGTHVCVSCTWTHEENDSPDEERVLKLRTHVQETHNKFRPGLKIVRKKKCTICSEVLNSFRALRVHKSKVHFKDQVLKCRFCPKSFMRHEISSKHLHEEAAHLSKDKKTRLSYHCNLCPQVFFTNFYLRKHKVLHKKKGTVRLRKRSTKYYPDLETYELDTEKVK